MELSFLGKPVELGRIDGELRALWETDEASSKASLINFALYNENPDALATNHEMVARLTREHACRALLIAVDRSKTAPAARAWITAHCQLKNGDRAICSEQVAFLIDAGGAEMIRNVVFAHLDSDLPLVFWWQGDFSDAFEDRLYSIIDRLIIDSGSWQRDPAAQFARLEKAYQDPSSRFVVNDISWSRSYHMRQGLAHCFDDLPSRSCLSKINRLNLVVSDNRRTAGLMLVAWIAARLARGIEHVGDAIQLVAGDQQTIEVEVGTDSQPGCCIRSLALTGPKCRFHLHHDHGSSHLRIEAETPDHDMRHVIPADHDDEVDLVSEQLQRAGINRLYFEMIPALRKLLAGSK